MGTNKLSQAVFGFHGSQDRVLLGFLLPFFVLLCLGLSKAGAEEAEGNSQQRAYKANQQTQVIVNDRLTLTFEGEARLSQVLEAAFNQWRAQVGERLEVYWPAARIAMVAGADSQQAELESQRLDLLGRLKSVAKDYEAQGKREQAAQFLSLADQLSGMVLAWQPFGQPKLAASRLFIEDNPILTQGTYHLSLPERAPYLYIYGLTKSFGQQQVFSQQTVRGYLKPHLDNELLWPDANRHAVYYFDHALAEAGPAENWVQQVPWGAHNARDTQVMPGDLLYLGLDEGAWAKNGWNWTQEGKLYAQINAQMIGLLAHWWSDPGAQFMDSSIVHQVEQRIPDVRHWERLDFSPSRNNYGGVGLLQTPTARMAPEGEAILSYTDMKEYRRYSASIQVLPWLEATGFYVQAPNRLYSPYPGFSGNTYYTDKGFDVKARLWQESNWLPEISVGLSDFAGTGLFSSEYFVANKRLGPFDFSLGMGFGRLGTRNNFPNIFCEVKNGFCERASGYGGMGGKPEVSKWFRGDAALFGGVEYQTPWPELRLKLEFEGNDYSRDRAGVEIKPSSPVNFGLLYQPYKGLHFQLGVERGDTLSLGFVLRTNFNTLKQIRVEPDKVAVAEQAPQRDIKDVSWLGLEHKIYRQYAYANSKFQLESTAEDAYILRLYGDPLRYRDSTEAIERTARVLAQELPESVHTYEIIEQSMFMPQVKYEVDAATFRKQMTNALPPGAKTKYQVQNALKNRQNTQADQEAEPDTHQEEQATKGRQAGAMSYQRKEAPNAPPWWDESWQNARPYRFKPGYSMQPFFIQDFGAAETFQFYQLGLKGSVQHWLNEKTWFVTDVGVNLHNNFHKFNYKVDAFDDLPLPRVRTYSREYIDHDYWIDTLQITRFERLSDEFYGMAYAGIFERMYAGVGGEVLWRPIDSPLALGLDVNWVKQRAFNGWLGMRDYSTATGFLTAYYQMPWLKDSLLQVGVGQFLARDKGAAIQFQRRFDSGIIIGAYANLTNVSSADYGEGSFTKGVFMSIPFDLLSVLPNRKRLNFGWVPLSRDGGQQLQKRVDLYGTTDIRSPYYHR